jgi:pimeloyl-ACP methyl ester carboxylesterase
MSAATEEQLAQVNGVELCWQGFGDPNDPALVLLHGAGDSMLAWREGLCERLADGGRYVVRTDSRDAGRSTGYEPGSPGYSDGDLVADVVALIEALGLERVHLGGLSGGGALAQAVAVAHPEKLATLTLFSTTLSEPGRDTQGLPGPTPEVAAAFSDEGGEPDWADRDAVIDYLVELERPFAGSGGYDADAQREYAGRAFDRTHNLAAQLTNPFRVESEPWRGHLGDLALPTLVIHGDDDPLFPLPHGQALAREIPGAELLVLEGVGHEYPPPRTWDEVVPAILRHTAAPKENE